MRRRAEARWQVRPDGAGAQSERQVRLLQASAQNPDLNLIQPNEPENSYLYLKLIGDDAIVGNAMPYNPLTGEGTLTEAEIADVLTWITNGAVENQ